jgi:hypothetical protein
VAGESAQREYERQRANRRGRVRRSWRSIIVSVVIAFAVGWLVPIVLMSAAMSMIESVAAGGEQSLSVHVPPLVVSWVSGLAFAARAATMLLAPSQAELAWGKGAQGERVVGAALDALSNDGVRVLHDRKIPGCRANIDHVAVTPAGVFTVDAKRYSGRLEVRARGREIWIKGRNRSNLLEQARSQTQTVTSVLENAGLEGVPVTPVLCFVETELPWLLAPKQVAGVLMTTPQKLHKRLLRPAPPGVMPLNPSRLPTVVATLDAALVPAVAGKVGPGGDECAELGAVDAGRPALAATPTPSAAPSCDRCGGQMVNRQRRRDGSPFYGCSNFPACRYTKPLDGARPPLPRASG